MSDSRAIRIAEMLQCIQPVRRASEQDALLGALATAKKTVVVSFINAHGFNLAWGDAAISDRFSSSNVLLRDGVGLKMLMRLLRMDVGMNMNGTDFIPKIVQTFKGRRIALCGTDTEYLTAAVAVAEQLGGKVVLTMDGFAAPETYVENIQAARPDLVILGMGMPKQETIAVILAQKLTQPTVIVNGGAILDFWAKRFPRAPLLWQKLHIEWLFRLIQEPRRLWRRYLLGSLTLALSGLQLKANQRATGLPVKTALQVNDDNSQDVLSQALEKLMSHNPGRGVDDADKTAAPEKSRRAA